MRPCVLVYTLDQPGIGQDDDRAGRMPDDMHTGRADQRVMERAVTMAAQDNQVRINRGATELLAWPALQDLPLHDELETLTDYGFQGPALHVDGTVPGLGRAADRRTGLQPVTIMSSMS